MRQPDKHAINIQRRVHLAVLTKNPWLDMVVAGHKVIESRWGAVKCAPHFAVRLGDLVLMKAPGGPVLGGCTVANACTYDIGPTSVWKAGTLLWDYGSQIGIPRSEANAFLKTVEDKRWATLVWLGPWMPIEPFRVAKKGRSGWDVICESAEHEAIRRHPRTPAP